MTPCPFCNPDTSKILLSNAHALAISDAYPVSPGHALIVPRRHIASFFETTREEQIAMFDLVGQVRSKLLNPYQPTIAKEESVSIPDGFNIGINDGTVAGQTVMHLHIHLIPRYSGDSSDPRGGVRWIMPEKARYWS